jgi:protein translocase SecG subunit
MINFLLESGSGLQSDFITTFFPILRIILVAIMFVCAIGIIVAVLIQSDAASGGTNVISGERESYYAQNRGDSRDGKLKKMTIILSCVIAVSVLIYYITLMINRLA